MLLARSALGLERGEREQQIGEEEMQGTDWGSFLRAGSGVSQGLSPLDEGRGGCHSFFGD